MKLNLFTNVEDLDVSPTIANAVLPAGLAKFGKGLTVKRLTDNAIFSICPADIKVAFSF